MGDNSGTRLRVGVRVDLTGKTESLTRELGRATLIVLMGKRNTCKGTG